MPTIDITKSLDNFGFLGPKKSPQPDNTPLTSTNHESVSETHTTPKEEGLRTFRTGSSYVRAYSCKNEIKGEKEDIYTEECGLGAVRNVRELEPTFDGSRGWSSLPPGNLPLDKAIHRPSSRHREKVIGYVFRQTGRANPNLRAWLVNRESEYFDSVGSKWDCSILAYCAALDCAKWQLNRSEQEVWSLLDGFNEVVASLS